jgi:hypothetical protein
VLAPTCQDAAFVTCGSVPHGERFASGPAGSGSQWRPYWPQLRPFTPPSAVTVKSQDMNLRQTRYKSATIIEFLRSSCRSLPLVATWDKAAELLPVDLGREVLDVVEHAVARYTLVRLQTVDNGAQPFIYGIDWGEKVTRPQSAATGGGRIRLRPNARRPACAPDPDRATAHRIALGAYGRAPQYLSLVGEALHEHLFGAEGVAFPTDLRKGLLETQHGAWFWRL